VSYGTVMTLSQKQFDKAEEVLILTINEAQEVADLITDITVANMMLERNNGKQEGAQLRWYCNLERLTAATIALSDKFGIDLPTLDLCREQHPKYQERVRDLMKAGNARTYG
jgi:hypothetical protein